MTPRRAAIEALRSATVELEEAVRELRQLAELRGQGDDALPLIVFESDHELVAAVAREVAAHRSVEQAVQQLEALQ